MIKGIKPKALLTFCRNYCETIVKWRPTWHFGRVIWAKVILTAEITSNSCITLKKHVTISKSQMHINYLTLFAIPFTDLERACVVLDRK